MNLYPTTRRFPETLSGRVSDLIPSFCRSVRINQEDNASCTITAHRSEIGAARKAIRIARAEAETAHIR